MNALHYFQALCQIKFVPVDDMLRCARYLQRVSNIETYPFSQDGLKGFVEETTWESWVARSASRDDFRFFECLIADIQEMVYDLDRDELVFAAEEDDFEYIISKMREILEVELGKLGISLPKASIEFVDQFPGIYKDRNYMALTVDEGDRKEHGIDPGVFVKRDKYVPVFGRTIFLHEYIHVILGDEQPFELARGLEEGICELLGFLFLGQKAIGQAAVRNAFIYVRLRDEQLPMWSLYLDYTRQARAIFNEFGLEGIAELVRRGRSEIRRAEATILKQGVAELDLPRGNYDKALSETLNWLLDCFIPQMAVSPEAFILSQHLKPGITIVELKNLSGFTDREFERGIADLEGHVRMASVREDRSVVSFCQGFDPKNKYLLRYKCPLGD